MSNLKKLSTNDLSELQALCNRITNEIVTYSHVSEHLPEPIKKGIETLTEKLSSEADRREVDYKLEVVCFGELKEFIKPELKGIKLFPESNGRFSFVCHNTRFEPIHKKVSENYNVYAVMAWNEIY